MANGIDSPGSPGISLKPQRTTMNIVKRRFSTTAAMQLDMTKMPGLVVPEITSDEPKF